MVENKTKEKPVAAQRVFSSCDKFKLFPLFFRILLLLIYALYLIPNGNFVPTFLHIISFIKIFVAEKVAKSPAE